jgi:hypothetical protein
MSIDIPDSSALPIERRKNRKRRKRQAATQEGRDALQLKAIQAEFDWSNQDGPTHGCRGCGLRPSC